MVHLISPIRDVRFAGLLIYRVCNSCKTWIDSFGLWVFFLKKAMISREKSILAPICWNAKILESIDQIWFHATFFSVLVFLFGIYGEFTHITINLFQSLKCLRTWKHMKDFSVMKASQFIEIDWWCWWIKSAYNRYT